MDNKFTIDQLPKSETIHPNSINRLYKINKMLDFMEIRFNNPRLTQKQICNQLGFSESTIKRYRDDINMDSPYNRNNNKKKKTKQLPDTKIENISKNENTKSVTDESSKNKIIEKRIKNRLKNDIKGGNVSNSHTLSSKEIIDYAFQKDNHLSGKELIEQAFNTNLND